GAFAGLRHAEIDRLEWHEIDLEDGFIEVKAIKSKTGERRLVPIHDNLKEWLLPYRQPTGKVSERLRILDDSEAGEFWLYEPGRKFDGRKTLKFGKRQMEVPDFSERQRGCLYIIDEVHVYFGAREWQATGSDCTYFLSQHRKIGCDVVLVTQHPEQTDKALRRLAQEYMVVRNLSREPIFGFRIANFFRTIRMLNSPSSPNPAPFDSGFVKLRPEVYGKLYDTNAGVGIAGRLNPSNEQRGIHWYWLGAPVAAIVLFFLWLFTHLHFVQREISSRFFHMAASGFRSAMNHPLLQVSHPGFAITRPAAPEPPAPVAAAVSSNELAGLVVYCSGYAVLDKVVMVFLSDGRIARSDWGDVQFVGSQKVEVFGRAFPLYTTAQIERSHPEMNFTAGPEPSGLAARGVELSSGSTPGPTPPIILPLHDYRQNLHNVKPVGFQGRGSRNTAEP
ncbi:MAG: zonular occludens toxin domain-containing protein, partial [Limisphaerales bacterium]